MKTMRAKPIEKSLPVLGFNGDILVSNNLDAGFGLELVLPELLSLSCERIYMLHDTFRRTVNLLPENTLLHKQDFFFAEHFEDSGNGKERQSKAEKSLDSSYL